jgi:P-type Ca2+ transporter type 2C
MPRKVEGRSAIESPAARERPPSAADELREPAGLSSAEARRRLTESGPNRLVELERWAWLKQLLGVVADPMAIMLALAGAVYLALGETKDGVILLAAIAPVLAVDVLLEARSRKALKRLAAAVKPRARVLRDGAEQDVPSETLVPGDLLLLLEGDILHADGVVRRAANLTIDESQLTGESEPLAKRPHPGAAQAAADPETSFFAGSLVLAGHGLGEVTSTGPRTRFGRVAHLVAGAAPDPTPLQRKTGRVVKVLALAAVAVAVAVFLLGVWRGTDVYHALLTALSVAISAVPEEFPLVFTIFLSMGALRLSRRGVLVRRLAAVETLGSTTVICTDKTGTLTTGQFAVDARVVLAAGASDAALLEAAVLACEPRPSDAMERALLAHAREHGVPAERLHARWALVQDYDFDSVGKHMSHGWRSAEGGAPARICAKGALEGVLEHCELTCGEREQAELANAELAGRGMRVLAVAERVGGVLSGTRRHDERGLRLLGLIGFRDPLRPQVAAAVRQCGEAGIHLKIVTGDHALTAHAIAEAAGIPHVDDGIVTGDELDALDGEARAERVRRATIFARVRPEQKHAIVETLSRSGEVVAMTGDGINDAPALRRADIGISYGIRGTEVARAAADLVLLDDDFTALVATVREGRGIYANLQRAFLYLLSFKLRVVGLAILVPLVGLPAFFQPVHLVWLELIVHPVSALVFEAEPPPPDVMLRPPRDPRAPLVPRRLVLRSLLSGAFLMIAALWAYAAHLAQGVAYARSLGIAVIIAGSLLLVWAERAGERSIFAVPLPRTWRFWLTWGGVALSLPLFMHVPAVASVFQIQPLERSDWALVMGISVASVAWRAIPWRRARQH